MKKYLALAAIALILAAPGLAFSQQTQPQQTLSQETPVSFPEKKSRALERITDRIAVLQQEQTCVQASTDRPSLAACYPEKPPRQQ